MASVHPGIELNPELKYAIRILWTLYSRPTNLPLLQIVNLHSLYCCTLNIMALGPQTLCMNEWMRSRNDEEMPFGGMGVVWKKLSTTQPDWQLHQIFFYKMLRHFHWFAVEWNREALKQKEVLAYLLQTETSFTLFVHIDVTHLSWRDVTNFFVKKGTSFIWAKKITRLSWLCISFDGNTQR